MDSLNKSSHFHPVKVTYSTEDYAKLHLKTNCEISYTYHYLKSFQSGIGTKVKLTTSFVEQGIYFLDETSVIYLSEVADKPLLSFHHNHTVKFCRALKTFNIQIEVYFDFILKIDKDIQYSKTVSHL